MKENQHPKLVQAAAVLTAWALPYAIGAAALKLDGLISTSWLLLMLPVWLPAALVWGVQLLLTLACMVLASLRWLIEKLAGGI